MTKDQFTQAAGLSGAMADKWYEPVEQAMVEFAIVSPLRAAMFIAQIGHESAGFMRTREIWGPTDAQRRYEGRADLGNTQAGDGSRYRGRGLIQITGRANYAAVSKGLSANFIAEPELLETTVYAARSAGWWWANNGCNELADTGDVARVTRRINGGLNGLADRERRFYQAIKFLG